MCPLTLSRALSACLKGAQLAFQMWAWTSLAFARSLWVVWNLHTDLHIVIMINNTTTPWQTREEFREGPGTDTTSLLPSGEELIFSQVPSSTALTPGRRHISLWVDKSQKGHFPLVFHHMSNLDELKPTTSLLLRFAMGMQNIPIVLHLLGSSGDCPKAWRLKRSVRLGTSFLPWSGQLMRQLGLLGLVSPVKRGHSFRHSLLHSSLVQDSWSK